MEHRTLKKYLKAVYIFFFVLFSILAVSKVSYAQTKTSGIEIAPAFEEISLEKPGETKSLSIKLTNHTAQILSLRLFPIDFKQWDENGRISFFTNTVNTFSYSLSSFLSFETDRLTIDPGKAETVKISVTNRSDLSPGGHYAAVVAMVSDENSGDRITKIAPAVSTMILLRKVGGEKFNLSLKEVSWPNDLVVFGYPSEVSLVFQNEGNIHMVPYGRAEIRDMFGRLLYKGIVNTSSTRVFPESRRKIVVAVNAVDKGLPISLNHLYISGEDSLKKTKYSYREFFVYINPFFAGLVFLIIGILIVVLMRYKRKK